MKKILSLVLFVILYFFYSLPSVANSTFIDEKNSVPEDNSEPEISLIVDLVLDSAKNFLLSKAEQKIKYELPKIYSEPRYYTKFIACLALIIFLTFISFSIWYKYGKDGNIIPIITSSPPEKKNSAETEVIYSGKASLKGIVSLIFYLASKGYIKIIDDGQNFILQKLKNYTGENNFEKRMMDMLFEYSDSVTQKELEVSQTFYQRCNSLVLALNRTRHFIFCKESISLEKMAIILFSLMGQIILLFFILGNFEMKSPVTFPSFILIFWLIVLYFISKCKLHVVAGCFFRILIFCFMFIPGLFFLFHIFNVIVNLPLIILDIAGITASIICLKHLPQYNADGRFLVAKILGFKKFIEAAERRRVEELVLDNPEYCLDVIPYAYLFDLADKWMANYEDLMTRIPSWYQGTINEAGFQRLSNTMLELTKPSIQNGGIIPNTDYNSSYKRI